MPCPWRLAVEVIEQQLRRVDVLEDRHVFKPVFTFRQEGREKQRQGRVLGAAGRDGAVQRHAARDMHYIHFLSC
jgi:hypothetical protein